MKVCVIGAGAIGGFIGASLAASGCTTSAIARGPTLDALRSQGWRLQLRDELVAAPVHAVEDTAGLGHQDLVVIAVKAPALADVAPAVTPLLGPRTMVLTAMNGVPWWFLDGFGGPAAGSQLLSVDPDGSIAAAIPTAHVIGCVVHATCSVPEPGLVRHGAGRGLIVGEPAGGESERLRGLADLLCAAGFDTTVSPRIQTDIWYKLWGNMTMNPVSVLTGATCDLILDDPLVNQFCLAVMSEAAEIGTRIGCPIGQSGTERNAITRRLGSFKTSMLRDAEAGKPLELDGLVSAVAEIGHRTGTPTPFIDALLGLTRLNARVRGLYPW
jgi:2-dehydropantoate 2-reductase